MSEAWVRKKVFQRAIPHLKIGRSVRFRRSDLDAYLRSRRIDAAQTQTMPG
jgi:excisionase family DNA binding protein